MLRGDGETRRSMVWKVTFGARLQSAEHACANLKLVISMSPLLNMPETCPPFRIDGNPRPMHKSLTWLKSK